VGEGVLRTVRNHIHSGVVVVEERAAEWMVTMSMVVLPNKVVNPLPIVVFLASKVNDESVYKPLEDLKLIIKVVIIRFDPIDVLLNPLRII